MRGGTQGLLADTCRLRAVTRRVLVTLAGGAVMACGGRESAAPEPSPPARLAPIPAPAGPYEVGSVLLDVEDPEPAERRPDGLPRTIEAQVWYPAHPESGVDRMPYLPRPAVRSAMAARGYLEQPVERVVSWARLVTPAYVAALPLPLPGGVPVLLFSPERGAVVSGYTALVQDLASRGFIVIGVDHRVPGPSAIRRTTLSAAHGAADESVELWARDLSIALRRFTAASGSIGAIARHADPTRAGVFGHGVGGSVAVAACAREAVLRRCATVSGPPPSGSQTMPANPLLVLAAGEAPSRGRLERLGIASEAWHAYTRAAHERWITLLAGAAAQGMMVSARGSGHMSFGDAPFLMPELALEWGGTATEAERRHAATVDLLAAFFRADADPLAAADSVVARYPALLDAP